jgi:hypothetical protein
MSLPKLLPKFLYSCLLWLSITSLTFVTAASVPYKLNLDIIGFNGLTINSPSLLNENPNSPLNTQSALLAINPSIPENVTVTVTTNSQCTVTGSPLVLTGTLLPGSTTGNINFTAVNDGIAETMGNVCLATYTFVSTNPLYNGSVNAVINIIDWNPTVLIENINQVDENPLALNHSNQIRIKLSDLPSSPVTLTVNYDSAQLGVAPITIVLDTTNWNTGVLVTTTAINDGLQEPTPHYSVLSFIASPFSAVEFANKNWNATIAIKDYTITIPVIVRTGAQNILPVLGFASFVMILVYFFVISNREERVKAEVAKTTTI